MQKAWRNDSSLEWRKRSRLSIWMGGHTQQTPPRPHRLYLCHNNTLNCETVEGWVAYSVKLDAPPTVYSQCYEKYLPLSSIHHRVVATCTACWKGRCSNGQQLRGPAAACITSGLFFSSSNGSSLSKLFRSKVLFSTLTQFYSEHFGQSDVSPFQRFSFPLSWAELNC